MSVDARDVLAARRELAPGKSVLEHAETIYIAVLSVGILGSVFLGTWHGLGAFLLDLIRPYRAIVGAPAVFLVGLAVVRFCTWQGFVSFSEADCAHLLTAPAPRGGLVWPRLRNAGLLLGFGGAAIGVVISLAPGVHAAHLGGVIQGAAAGLALGVLVVAAGWQVQRLPRVALWVLRLTMPALVLAGLLVFGSRVGGAGRQAVLWSGPWGWALFPFRAGDWVSGLVGLGLLGTLAVGGWVSLSRTAGSCSLETFRARARTRARMVAGLYSLDSRALVKARRESRPARWQLRLRLRVPRHAGLVIPWRGTLNLLRSPVRLIWSAVLGGGAILILAGAPGRPGSLVGGAVALYLAAGSLLEPLRLEADAPVVSQVLLRWSYGKVLWLHCLLPAAVLTVVGSAALAGGWAAGLVGGSVVPAAFVLLIPEVAVMVLAAALSARRGGGIPTSILSLTAGDPFGGGLLIVLLWAVGWALLAVAAVALGVHVLGSSATALSGAVTAAMGLSTLAILLRSVLVGTSR
ncbi:MAG: hypothetical protein ACYC6T_13595 [Thermoleophilia bacterium]